jgi:hypothetical protein
MIIGNRWNQLEGEKSHPGGIIGPSKAALGATPWSGRTIIEKPTMRVPISVSFKYAAAVGAQKTKGANIIHRPIKAQIHRADDKRQDKHNDAKKIRALPLIISLNTRG